MVHRFGAMAMACVSFLAQAPLRWQQEAVAQQSAPPPPLGGAVKSKLALQNFSSAHCQTQAWKAFRACKHSALLLLGQAGLAARFRESALQEGLCDFLSLWFMPMLQHVVSSCFCKDAAFSGPDRWAAPLLAHRKGCGHLRL